MSTAGKVLISLILLMALVWIIATAGVDQLNRNGNELLNKLHVQVADLSEKLKKVQHDIIATKDRITVQQETTDREITRLRAKQTDLERGRSEISELLVEVQLELSNLEHTVNNAKLADERRLAEAEHEKKEIAALETELAALKGNNKQMLARIDDLRDKFRTSYRASLDLVNRAK